MLLPSNGEYRPVEPPKEEVEKELLWPELPAGNATTTACTHFEILSPVGNNILLFQKPGARHQPVRNRPPFNGDD